MNCCWSCHRKQFLRRSNRNFHILLSNGQRISTTSRHVHTTVVENVTPKVPIRQRLARWQEENGRPLSSLFVTADSITRHASSEQSLEDMQESSVIDQLFESASEEFGHAGEIVTRKHLDPGDLVELGSASDPEIGVFIRLVTGTDAQVITLRGKWMYTRVDRLKYSVPRWMDSSVIKKLLPYLPAGKLPEDLLDQMHALDLRVPSSVSGPVVMALAEFWDEMHAVHRRHTSRLTGAYDILAHETDLRTTSLEEIAKVLIGDAGEALTEPALYAVRRALHYAGAGFMTSPTYFRINQLYQIIPKQQIRDVFMVRDWLREYRDQVSNVSSSSDLSRNARYIHDFITHARELIQESRKVRAALPNGLGTDTRSITGLPQDQRIRRRGRQGFNQFESRIIRFLELTYFQAIFSQQPGLSSIASVILRGSGCYKDMALDFKVGFMFLQELGVLSPYIDKTLFDTQLLLPSSQHSLQLQQLASRVKELENSKDKITDAMTSLRYDWGSLVVYCVDPAGSHEIDDGISVERIAGSDQVWVRIHVANPTAFLRPGDIISKLSENLTETFYSPEYHYPMLPQWLSEKCSIGAGKPCLSLSARLDGGGRILEIDARPGLVNNVVTITYDQLSSFLGQPVTEPIRLAIGGSIRKTPQEMPELSEQDLTNLKCLQQIASKLRRRRLDKGGVALRSSAFEIAVSDDGLTSGLPFSYPNRLYPRDWMGDPRISIGVQALPLPHSSAATTDAYDIIQEFMILGGNVAGRWSWQRRLPSLYRGQPTHAPIEEMLQWRNKNLAPYMPSTNKFDLDAFVRIKAFSSFFAPSYIGPKPSYLPAMGIFNYVKATSPLRRFGDMVVHWQMEAAMRGEAGMSGGGLKKIPGTDVMVSFDQAQLDAISSRIMFRERFITNAKSACNRHWITHYFFRAFYFNEAPLPQTFRVLILGDELKDLHVGTIMDWSIRLYMRPEKTVVARHGGVNRFDIWEVEIEEVVLFQKCIIAKPIRLLERATPELLNWYSEATVAIMARNEMFVQLEE